MTDQDREFIRQHHVELTALVRDGIATVSPASTTSQPTRTPLPTPKDTEPDPVMWTYDYTRRITAEDVVACGVKVGSGSKREAYERTREILDEQQRQRRCEQLTAEMLAYRPSDDDDI